MPPAELYRARLADREAQADRLERRDAHIASARLGLFVGALALAAWAFANDAVSLWWLLVPAAAFAGLAVWHGDVRRARQRAQRAADFYRQGLARMEDRWSGGGQTGERFADPHHVYSADLDLFGRGSLFELLFTGRTRMGETTLARWLSGPAPIAELRARHSCVAELRQLTDLREDIALLGAEANVGVHPDELRQWASAANQIERRDVLPLAVGLPVLLLASAMVYSQWGLLTPLVAVLAAEAIMLRRWHARLRETLLGVERAFEDLRLLAALFARLERETFASPALRALTERLLSHHVPASRAIARLATVVQLVESRRNPILHVLDVPLMYSLHVALAAQRWRADHGVAVAAWLDTIGEIEALLSLATYSYEHPTDPFPELIEGPATFEAQALGHPLLAESRCVRNDVSIAAPVRVLLISGSNMSGKSTLLRAVGTNTVLAMAGAPVRARKLVLTCLQVGASIRINDSLHEGSSRFYAEITRLKQLNELLDAGPRLLFLLDELLQGTNSKDRRAGADGVVRAFLAHGAIGLVSTHDLALTDLAGADDGRLRNLHFQDDLVAGRMSFDFKLRDGIVTKSNGLELMRSIGLDV